MRSGLRLRALEPFVAAVSVMAAVLGLVLSAAIYQRGVGRLESERTVLGAVYPVLFTAYGIDAGVTRFLVEPLKSVAAWSYGFIDRKVIDGAAEGTGKLSMVLGRLVSGLQTGETDVYASLTGVGFVVLMGVAIWLGRG